MLTPRLAHKRLEKGQAAVELLLALLILVLVTYAGIELSRGVAIRQALDSGTAASVRALSLDPTQWTYSSNLVQQSVQQNVMGTNPAITIKVYDSTGTAHSAAWLSGSPFSTGFILESSAPFQADIPFLTLSPITITVRHWGIVERYP